MSAIQPEQVAEMVAKTLAAAARRASLPVVDRIAFKADQVALEANDGTFFVLRVEVADHIAFYGDEG